MDYKPIPMWQWFAMATVSFGQAFAEFRGSGSWHIAGWFVAGGVMALGGAAFGWRARRAEPKKPTIQV